MYLRCSVLFVLSYFTINQVLAENPFSTTKTNVSNSHSGDYFYPSRYQVINNNLKGHFSEHKNGKEALNTLLSEFIHKEITSDIVLSENITNGNENSLEINSKVVDEDEGNINLIEDIQHSLRQDVLENYEEEDNEDDDDDEEDEEEDEEDYEDEEDEEDYKPTKVHLAYGESLDEVVVTWSTLLDTDHIVEYGIGNLNLSSNGTSVELENKERSQFIHKVTLSKLELNSTYTYRCGGELGWSEEFSFRSIPNLSTGWSPTLLIYGDLGVDSKLIPFLLDHLEKNSYDAILHVGDIAYNLSTDSGRVGDLFLSQIEGIASKIPYMTAPGNHEKHNEFIDYRLRFNMPGGTENFYYSFDMGPAHFICFSTDALSSRFYDQQIREDQLKWIEHDLQMAQANRDNVPWIITYGHYPMYCSNKMENCKKNKSKTRKPLEKLFYDNGVDMEFWGHRHSYERMWPVYNNMTYNGTTEEPYKNPKAPVHIVVGTGGNEFEMYHFMKIPFDWSAFRSADMGFGRLQIVNKTHLKYDQVSADQDGEVIDSFWVVKDLKESN